MRNSLFVVATTLLIGCSFQPDYPLDVHVTGRVTSATDSVTISGAVIKLGKTELSHGEELARTVTDGSGRYTIRTSLQKEDCSILGLYLTVTAPGFHTNGVGFGYESNPPRCHEGVQEIDVVLEPFSSD